MKEDLTELQDENHKNINLLLTTRNLQRDEIIANILQVPRNLAQDHQKTKLNKLFVKLRIIDQDFLKELSLHKELEEEITNIIATKATQFITFQEIMNHLNVYGQQDFSISFNEYARSLFSSRPDKHKATLEKYASDEEKKQMQKIINSKAGDSLSQDDIILSINKRQKREITLRQSNSRIIPSIITKSTITDNADIDCESEFDLDQTVRDSKPVGNKKYEKNNENRTISVSTAKNEIEIRLEFNKNKLLIYCDKTYPIMLKHRIQISKFPFVEEIQLGLIKKVFNEKPDLKNMLINGSIDSISIYRQDIQNPLSLAIMSDSLQEEKESQNINLTPNETNSINLINQIAKEYNLEIVRRSNRAMSALTQKNILELNPTKNCNTNVVSKSSFNVKPNPNPRPKSSTQQLEHNQCCSIS